MTTRDEHLQWCKDRALEYVDRGDLSDALASFGSDAKKWDDGDLLGEAGTMLLGMEGFRCVLSGDTRGMRRLIKGFH